MKRIKLLKLFIVVLSPFVFGLIVYTFFYWKMLESREKGRAKAYHKAIATSLVRAIISEHDENQNKSLAAILNKHKRTYFERHYIFNRNNSCWEKVFNRSAGIEILLIMYCEDPLVDFQYIVVIYKDGDIFTKCYNRRVTFYDKSLLFN